MSDGLEECALSIRIRFGSINTIEHPVHDDSILRRVNVLDGTSAKRNGK